MTMESARVETPDGINWYIERFIPPPPARNTASTPMILIPSGEGDCGNLQALGTLLAERGYHALSFDNPGFSRTTAPPEAYTTITPLLFTTQLTTLLDALAIRRAAFFGNSSGGGAVLALTALHPSRVRAAIVHEVPLAPVAALSAQLGQPDGEVAAWCAAFFADHFVEPDRRAAWDALGPAYHARLARNYPVWIRGIVGGGWIEQTAEVVTAERLRGRPVFWTVGGRSAREHWAPDFELAARAGLEVRTDVLDCLHFPYVTVPEALRDWVVECVERTEA